MRRVRSMAPACASRLDPRCFLRVFMVCCLWAAVLAAASSWPSAAHAEAPAEPAALLEGARKQMDAVRSARVDQLDEAGTLELRKRALAAQVDADAAAEAFAPELTDVQARLAELGTPAKDAKESPDVAAQRAQLTKAVATLDSQIKLARLLAVEAEQAAATALAQRRLQFGARLSERTPAVVGPAFWNELRSDAPADWRRLKALGAEWRRSIGAVSPGSWLVVAAVVAALLLARAVAQRVLLHIATERVPPGRLRRSLHAAGTLALWTLTPGLAAHAALVGLESGGPVPAVVARLLVSMEAILWFAGFVAGLGAALLMADKPSWRLPPISNATARRLRWFPHLAAAAVVLGWASSRVALAIDAGLATTWAVNLLTSSTFAALTACALLRIKKSRGPADTQAGASDRPPEPAGQGATEPVAAPLWLPTLRGAVWAVMLASLAASLAGYVALGAFAVSQLVWGLIVFATGYLLAALVDDLFMTLLAPTAAPSEGASDGPPPAGDTPTGAAAAPKTREQTAVLLSGLSRILIASFAVVLLMAPFGEGPLELLRRAGRVGEGIAIGEFNVKPSALLQAGLVLVLGLFAVRAFKGWLVERYMPTTRMDAGMRLSVGTLIGYVGAVVVVALAMSAVGVGLERVAWVASALSVGIGFGLQAVVQNFVSGLILLAERPVKVGDWVSLAGVEGDIRRINVRATEIQMGDRSTVIVPNSEFITKIVRNVTYTDPLGMVQIKLPMPLSTDTRKAREVLLQALQEHPGVLDSPAPNVQLDGIDGANLVFNATGFVRSPRAAYGVRSDVLFDALERLRDAGLALGKPPTMLLSPVAAAVGEAPPANVAQPAPGD